MRGVTTVGSVLFLDFSYCEKVWNFTCLENHYRLLAPNNYYVEVTTSTLNLLLLLSLNHGLHKGNLSATTYFFSDLSSSAVMPLAEQKRFCG